jgi:hypothetical protein
MRRFRAFAAVVAFCAAAAPGQPVLAAEADELILKGIELRKENRDREALTLFKKAVEIQPTPRATAQLGLCEQALGLWVGAEKHLEAALQQPDDAWIKKNAATLRKALEVVRGSIGMLDIWGPPDGARVSIDGEAAGTIPFAAPARLAEGPHTVTVEAAGFAPDTRTLNVKAGQLVRTHVMLVAAAPARPGPGVPGPGGGQPPADPPPGLVVAAGGPGAAQPGPSGDADGGAFYRRWWFWAIVAGVAVAAGTSILLLTRDETACRTPMGEPCDRF